MVLTYSLRRFLKTGLLGPVRPGMTMMELGREFGPLCAGILQRDETAPTFRARSRLPKARHAGQRHSVFLANFNIYVDLRYI